MERRLNTQQKQAAQSSVEKTYLHLDKDYYSAGDTLWLKAYLTIGSQHQLSALSNVLHVDLIDSKDSIRHSLNLFVKNGLAQCDMDLPFTLESGDYRIRVYTNWMRNAGDECFFDKRITIFNPITASKVKSGEISSIVKTSVKKVSPDFDVQFFPEGGGLGFGVPCKIAFKAVDSFGRGVNVRGVVTDQQNDTVALIENSHLGMGIFMLTAEPEKNYRAIIKLPGGISKVVSLPSAVNPGFIMILRPSGTDNIRVIVQKVTNSGYVTNDGLTLIGRSGGDIYYQGESKPGDDSFSTIIPKSKFPTGIAQFTLYSAQGELLNERQVFIQNNDALKLNLIEIGHNHLPQQKMKFELLAKTTDGRPVHGSFSVSVVDEAKLPAGDDNESNIFSHLLLTSDLKGYVEDPAYYFADTGQKKVDELDALMLTQGYRKFTWNQINDSLRLAYEPEYGLSISGWLKNNKGKPIGNEKVLLMAADKGLMVIDTTTNSQGHFVFKNLMFSDTAKFMFQVGLGKQRNDIHISIDKFDRPQVKTLKYPSRLPETDNEMRKLNIFNENSKLRYADQVKNYIAEGIMLKEVKIKAAKQPVLKRSGNLNGPGRADYVFTSAEIQKWGCGFIANCLSGRVPGLTLNNNGANAFLYLTKYATPSPKPMLVLVDGNPGDMNTLSPNSIASIEILSNMGSTAIYGSKGNYGVIIVTTKRGADETDITETRPGTITYTAKGFNKIREFYSPQYDDPKTNQNQANLRTTIYWNPMLQTDENGKVSFDYFNAGSKGSYRIVIEGIDGEGHIGRYVYRYKVE